MQPRRGLFWQSFCLTMLLIAALAATTAWFVAQRRQQQSLRAATQPVQGVQQEPGSRTVLRLLVAVQAEQPQFLLVRADAVARTVTLCGVPGQTVVSAPSGETTLADCYLAAGPARAAQLLADTLGLAPDGYFAATAETFARIAGSDTAVRFDTAAVLSAEQRQALGYAEQPVQALAASTTENFLQGAQPVLRPAESAKLRAALWAALLRQNPSLAETLVQSMRGESARTLTNLTAPQLLQLEQLLAFLQKHPESAVEYDVLPGRVRAVTGEYTLESESLAMAQRLLG